MRAILDRLGPSTSSGCGTSCRKKGRAYGILSLSKNLRPKDGRILEAIAVPPHCHPDPACVPARLRAGKAGDAKGIL